MNKQARHYKRKGFRRYDGQGTPPVSIAFKKSCALHSRDEITYRLESHKLNDGSYVVKVGRRIY